MSTPEAIAIAGIVYVLLWTIMRNHARARRRHHTPARGPIMPWQRIRRGE